jgi:pimeloyl-ACP methyl ester carboxylesterase
LDVAGKRWKLNLDVLGRDMQHILGFPELQGSFDGPTLFVSGSQSSYVHDDGKERAKHYFPKARFMKLKDTGHWLHAEKPREFEAAVRHFLAPSQ